LVGNSGGITLTNNYVPSCSLVQKIWVFVHLSMDSCGNIFVKSLSFHGFFGH
jgi:hypothetical protein